MPHYEEQHFIDTQKKVWNYSLFTDGDVASFQRGDHATLYEKFGAQKKQVFTTWGYYFAVWAPNATYVSVISEFNNWDESSHALYVRADGSGIWEGFIPNFGDSLPYKYYIKGYQGIELRKADPFAFMAEKRPNTASVSWYLDYPWNDNHWMHNRYKNNSLEAPWSVYEMHLGSWIKPEPGDEESYNTYHQIGDKLVPYLLETGFTHVEFMPVMEFPYDGSWGYQGAGYFAPTSRFGNTQDFMYLIDRLHQAGIGVILDWVPSHFPHDAHGLFMFDGTHTYEYADMRKGYHPDWNSYIFNYERSEVKSFLLSSACYWLDKYHVDGLRVDAVSSMIYLNYSRKDGEWEPNKFGGDGNLEAIDFIKQLNETIYNKFIGVQTIAEEATNYQWIAKPIYDGGLGFGMKWMMGWMHDTLKYFKMDPIFRQFHQNTLSFSIMYAFNENYMLPFSHDEVVHGKSPLLYKMPGDEWQKFANLRLMLAYMWTHPGTKLLFMGGELGQTSEWNYKTEIPWHLLNYDCHAKTKNFVSALNHLYKSEPALYQKQFSADGFEWVLIGNPSESIMAYLRKGNNEEENILVILNSTPTVKNNFKLTVKGKKTWKELLNSNHPDFWGTGDTYNDVILGEPNENDSTAFNLILQIPPLGALVLK
jgi:1,4-alpha-glucan branching enzyme